VIPGNRAVNEAYTYLWRAASKVHQRRQPDEIQSTHEFLRDFFSPERMRRPVVPFAWSHMKESPAKPDVDYKEDRNPAPVA
jgi:hypothetical protein